MTVVTQDSGAQQPGQEKPNSKDYNFQAIRQQLERQKAETDEAKRQTQEATKALEEMRKRMNSSDNDEDDSEPYVDRKKLERKLNSFGEKTQNDIQKTSEMTKQQVKDEIYQEMWLENNPDFMEILQHADKLLERSPQLAKAILRMPESFDRQKLVYQNIKELGLDKPEQKQQSMQEKIDSNRKPMFYQPTSVANAPYNQQGDFSKAGQKSSYDKMMELKGRMGGR